MFRQLNPPMLPQNRMSPSAGAGNALRLIEVAVISLLVVLVVVVLRIKAHTNCHDR